MKKIINMLLVLTLVASMLTMSVTAAGFSAKSSINVVSREDGSGTRGAFIELFKVQVTDAKGKKKDMTTKEAVIANKTDIMTTNVANDPNAIGYVSLGSLSKSVKALKIDGVEATAANVKNKKYAISRPFMIATKGVTSPATKDFIDYIMSKEGQAVIVNGGYIAARDNAAAFSGSKPGGKIVVAGSSSVTPIMEKLREAYLKINPNAKIEIQMSDSSIGMSSAIAGTCDIGMSSRELKDTEKEKLTEKKIAVDGIAVIVNNGNTYDSLTAEQVRKIFTGETTKWSDAAK